MKKYDKYKSEINVQEQGFMSALNSDESTQKKSTHWSHNEKKYIVSFNQYVKFFQLKLWYLIGNKLLTITATKNLCY